MTPISLSVLKSRRLLLRPREQPRPLGDVACDLGSADDETCIVINGRDRQRDGNERAILSLTNRLVMPNRLTRANLRQNEVFLALANLRNDDANRLADRLRSCVAKHALGGCIPRQDDSVQILADDGVIRRIDDLGEMPRRKIVGRVFHLSAARKEGPGQSVSHRERIAVATTTDKRRQAGLSTGMTWLCWSQTVWKVGPAATSL